MVFYQSCLRERAAGSKKIDNFCKKVLTNARQFGNILTVPQMGRVPCKLNNERNEKHQTGCTETCNQKLA